jgi:rhodanese-related sulfurtransferase
MKSVKPMSVNDLDNILKSGKTKEYQIIDVRESNELDIVKLKYDGVIHLPLSEVDSWSKKVLNGEMLEATMPTICLCKAGMRGMKVASFLGEWFGVERLDHILTTASYIFS